jgi:hypothetical protein
MQGNESVNRRTITPTAKGIDHSVAGHYYTGSRDAFFIEVPGVSLAWGVMPRRQFADAPPVALLRKWVLQVSTPYTGFYVTHWKRYFRGGHRARVGAGGVALNGYECVLCPGCCVAEQEFPE